MKTQIPHGDTKAMPVFDWATWPGELTGPQGPGKIYRATLSHSGRECWLHESPRGWQRPVGQSGEPMPELTRTPTPKPVGKCGCGEYHRCTQCGEQTWIEYHGVADGHCTYCRHSG